MNINRLFEEYRELTLYGTQKADDYEEIEKIIKKRQAIIELIENSNFERNIIAEMIKKYNLVELDSDFEKCIKKEMNQTKKAIDNLRRLRVARKSFMKKYEGTPTFFDTTS